MGENTFRFRKYKTPGKLTKFKFLRNTIQRTKVDLWERKLASSNHEYFQFHICTCKKLLGNSSRSSGNSSFKVAVGELDYILGVANASVESLLI